MATSLSTLAGLTVMDFASVWLAVTCSILVFSTEHANIWAAEPQTSAPTKAFQGRNGPPRKDDRDACTIYGTAGRSEELRSWT